MIDCPACHTPQPVSHAGTGRLHPCPGCSRPVRIEIFNALFRRQEIAPSENALTGEAECFEHAGKKAVFACDGCGRLMCDLCRVEMGGKNLCMHCLQTGRDKQRIDTLQNRRFQNDAMAFHLAFWPMMTIFLTLVTAPVALFFTIRHWRAPAGILPKRHLQNIIAHLLSLGQIAGWITFFVFMAGEHL